MGADSEEVLQELGWGKQRISRLMESGASGNRPEPAS